VAIYKALGRNLVVAIYKALRGKIHHYEFSKLEYEKEQETVRLMIERFTAILYDNGERKWRRS
jgi:hypothetical protein